MKKVMVGMSGGVDSSVAAMLLRDSGFEVMGVTLKLFSDEDIVEAQKEGKTCCALSDVMDARSVAYRLGFEHIVFNFKDCFRERVMSQFADSYMCGRIPNPCIECNRYVKFDKMLRRAIELGYDYIATGHYAVREYDEKSGRYLLKRPKDRSKDQTYVLYSLTQEQLAHTLFPLGELDKPQVRALAEKAGLVNSDKPDSQDICFVPDGDYVSFIEKFTGKEPVAGDFVDLDGNVLGRHKGIIGYTVGQRKDRDLSRQTCLRCEKGRCGEYRNTWQRVRSLYPNTHCRGRESYFRCRDRNSDAHYGKNALQSDRTAGSCVCT